jgi:hypothetical protein
LIPIKHADGQSNFIHITNLTIDRNVRAEEFQLRGHHRFQYFPEVEGWERKGLT